jgi:hypothetical protein
MAAFSTVLLKLVVKEKKNNTIKKINISNNINNNVNNSISSNSIKLLITINNRIIRKRNIQITIRITSINNIIDNIFYSDY